MNTLNDDGKDRARLLSGLSRWLLIGLSTLAAVGGLGFEVFRPISLSYDGLWNARTAVWASIILLANLVVLWWYALRTEEQAATSRQLFRIARDQFELAQEQHQAAERRASELRFPSVVVSWRYQPAPQFGLGDGWDFVAHNLGPGRGFNVVLILSYGAGPSFYPLGTLDAGSSVRLPQEVIGRLNQDAKEARGRHFLFSTPPDGETWLISENRVQTSNRVTNRTTVQYPDAQEKLAIQRGDLIELLSTNWPRYERAFSGE